MAVAVDSDIDNSYEIKDLQHSLRSANLELSLARSKHSVEAVVKDEDIRKLRVRQCLLEGDNSDLHEQLEEEQARADELEHALDDALLNLDEQKAEGEAAQNQIRTQSREIANLKAELKAMENVTSDSNKILSEKLALSREISSLRPEVEHLRAQVESNQGLLSEKLSLQRQFTTLQVELENEKRTSARTISKQGKKMEQDDDLRNELEEVRNELATEKKDRIKAEAAVAKAEKAVEKVQADLESQQRATEKLEAKLEKLAKKDTKASKRDDANDAALQELRQELDHEKALRIKAEKALKNASSESAEVERLREELELEKKARHKEEKAAKKNSQQTGQTGNAQEELEEEKRERKKQEKEYTKTLAELQGRNTVLDEKLSAFREKLRTTKEKLKEKEAQLEKVERAQTAPPSKSAAETTKAAKNIRKRVAASVEPETNLGTPGDVPAKRFKRGTSVSAMGDTSTFSLTPFLNRTGSVAPGSPIAEEDEDAEVDTAPIKAPKLKANPLVPTASVKANPKPRKKTALSTVLAAVSEEAPDASQTSDSENPAAQKIPLNDAADAGPTLKTKKLAAAKQNPRKSLMSFANFTEEPTAETKKKKKRKLGAATSKALFDDDDDDDAVAPSSSQPKPVGLGMGSGKGLFAARALGKSVLGKVSRPISGGFGMLSEEAFAFSPLKKDRRRAGDSILK
ncbi:21S rRNA (uridine(2791)-2'-O)-methyltransferase [Ascochyta rabiei]|uniref:21S rRNA (uridine(2791)-2'-O)-methyltransferase n=1 Tax=Didymella rabiei TaxID=5454 RepID=UPI0019000ADD|nr:21S rRNA (uridine(2791)-2'-O)-methyltransferase [Ascochyta rabiei]UPX09500.1 21S rRNA (uridine(2791)-2'-O)-methyltransferase [Ascochyta rabiei]